MNHAELDTILADIRRAREAMLAALADLAEDDFATPTDMARWDHMREHANQLEATLAAIGRGPTMPQRMPAESEQAWGKLLAATRNSKYESPTSG